MFSRCCSSSTTPSRAAEQGESLAGNIAWECFTTRKGRPNRPPLCFSGHEHDVAASASELRNSSPGDPGGLGPSASNGEHAICGMGEVPVDLLVGGVPDEAHMGIELLEDLVSRRGTLVEHCEENVLQCWSRCSIDTCGSIL